MTARRHAMFDHVFRDGRIGTLLLPHRIIMGSMHLGLESEPDGRALAAFYVERVRGGAALIVTGGSAISRVGAGARDYSFINEPSELPKWQHVVNAVHRAGGRIALQLFHAGRYGSMEHFGLQPAAPSPIESRYSKSPPRAMTAQEIMQTVEQFAAGARHAREIGFDAVELMGSEGYLLNQFLSPLTNHRDDEWGGDANRRMCFPLTVVRTIRSTVGVQFPLIYRISATDLMPGSSSEEEIDSFARHLAQAGVDAVNIGIGWHESSVPTVQAAVPPGAWIPQAVRIKQAAGSLPVIAGTRIHTIELADTVLAERSADFVSMARPFLADPSILNKYRTGHSKRVNICVACNQACIDRSLRGQRVSCMVNPRAGEELSLREYKRTRRPASFVVIGAGAAGLEAARVFCAAGHRVTLYEAAPQLGGQLRLAATIPHKHAFLRTIEYFEHELRRLGARIHLNQPLVTAPGGLADCHGVVLASGVRPRTFDLPGIDLPHVQSYADVLIQPTRQPGSVAIIGAGGIGLDVAHRLSSRGDTVTLLSRSATLGRHLGRSTRWVLLQSLRASGVEFITGVTCERIAPEGVWVHDAEGTTRLVSALSVVVAIGQDAHAPLADVLAATGIPFRIVGGARDAHGLDAVRAFHEGATAAHELIDRYEAHKLPYSDITRLAF